MPKGKANKRYTPEFKIKVVETMGREKLSYCEAARQFEISDHKIVARWERIYLEEGPDGLRIKRRGRKSTGQSPKLEKKVEEDCALSCGGCCFIKTAPLFADCIRNRLRIQGFIEHIHISDFKRKVGFFRLSCTLETYFE